MHYLFLSLQLVGIALGGLGLAVGIVRYREWGQLLNDQRRKTYSITFPRELKFDRVALMFTSLSGIRMRGVKITEKLSPSRTLCCEILASQTGGIEWLISFPEELRIQVESSLQGVIPGIGWVEVTPYHHLNPWMRVAELNAGRASFDPNSELIGALHKSLENLEPGDQICVQIVLQPVPYQIMVGEEGKEQPASFLTVVRLAGRAKDEDRAEQILHNVSNKYRALQVFFFKELKNAEERLSVNNQATPLHWPAAVTSTALAVAWASPCNVSPSQSIKLGGSRPLPPDNIVARDGFIIGTSTASGNQRPIAISASIEPQDIVHTDMVGKTGVGKSSLMGTMVLEQMKAGHGVGVLDPHGDLVDWILARMPRERIPDVVLVEPLNANAAIPFNIFDATDTPEAIAEKVCAIFEGIYRDTTGVLNANYLAGAIQALASVPGMTLIDVPHFLSDKSFRSRVMDRLDDPNLSYQWDLFEAMPVRQQEAYVAPGLRRLQPLLRKSSMRLMFGQSENALDMRRLVAERKIILMSLPDRLGEDTTGFIGSMFFNSLWASAQSVAARERVPFFLHMDEAQKFMHSSLPLDTLLNEARKFLIPLTIAHQAVVDPSIPPAMRLAINRNTRTKIIFQTSIDDAVQMARELGEPIIPNDLTTLNKREFILKTVNNEQTTVAMAVRSIESPPPVNNVEAIRELSRLQWTKPAREIDAAIIKRQRGDKAPREAGKPLVVGWEDDQEVTPKASS